MKRKVITALALIIFLCTAVLAGRYLNRELGAGKKLMITVKTVEDSVETEGFLVKNETIIDLSGGSFVRYYCKSGDRVFGGEKIASVYNDASDGNVLTEIQALEDKIEALQGDYVSLTPNNILKIETYISDEVKKLGDAVKSGDVHEAALIKGKLSTLFNIKHSNGEKAGHTRGELEAQKQALEGRLSSSKKDIYAPSSGVFSEKTDGFETLLPQTTSDGWTLTAFDSLMQKEEEEEESARCKIVDNYQWSYVCRVDASALASRPTGSTVKMLPPGGEAITGRISYISEAVNGVCIVTIDSERDFPGLESKRKMAIRLIFGSHTGYVIPRKAFHLYQGEYGVFIERGNRLAFRKADIIYEDEENAVVSTGEGTELKLYDTVVVEGDLSEYYD